MNILTSYLQVQFPLYFCTRFTKQSILDTISEDGIDYLILKSPNSEVKLAYNFNINADYIYKLSAFKKTKTMTLPFDYTFTSLVHLIWSYSINSIPQKCLIVDNRGNLFIRGIIKAPLQHVKPIARKENYIMIENYFPPIEIPNNPSVIEVLDHYNLPRVEVVEYLHTFFFRGIADPDATRRKREVRIL